MKTATKVFLIIGIVIGSLFVLYGVILFLCFSVIFDALWYETQYTDVYAVMSIFTVLGILLLLSGGAVIVTSAVALSKLDRAKRASDISTGLKVCVLIFGNTIAGILLLCMKDSDFADANRNGTPPPYDYNYYYPPYNGQPPQSGYPPYGSQPPQSGQYPPYGSQPPQSGQYPPYGNQPPQSGQYPPYGSQPPPPNGYYYPPYGNGQPPQNAQPPYDGQYAPPSESDKPQSGSDNDDNKE